MLTRAGCKPETLRRIHAFVSETWPDPEARAGKLVEIAAFARSIGTRAARDFFRAIEETNAVAELTDPRVLSFARSVDPHTAEWYFWAIWGTKAVPELTSEGLLRAAEFFRTVEELGGAAAVEYFLAIRDTRAVARLTDPRVLAFAQSIGSAAAMDYFGALWETKAVDVLTASKVLAFAQGLRGDAAREYFLAIRETKAVTELTEERVLELARRLGSPVAEDYFRAIRHTRAAGELTSDEVTVFAEVIGKACAREYFRVVDTTKRVAELTSARLLRASGVIRAIGSDAAADYFLAVAATDEVPTPPGPSEGPAARTEGSVPVLTLLDIPDYDRLRPLALAGVSALFWWSAWHLGTVSFSSTSGLLGLLATVGAWVAALGGTFFLTTEIARRSGEEFLRRRRRLLNEHGIRWHDCLSGDRHCPFCWNAAHTHVDDRFDYGRFCRCPAC